MIDASQIGPHKVRMGPYMMKMESRVGFVEYCEL
jgi:hypothetical protein